MSASVHVRHMICRAAAVCAVQGRCSSTDGLQAARVSGLRLGLGQCGQTVVKHGQQCVHIVTSQHTFCCRGYQISSPCSMCWLCRMVCAPVVDSCCSLVLHLQPIVDFRPVVLLLWRLATLLLQGRQQQQSRCGQASVQHCSSSRCPSCHWIPPA
jgi:hypothetical protein